METLKGILVPVERKIIPDAIDTLLGEFGLVRSHGDMYPTSCGTECLVWEHESIGRWRVHLYPDREEIGDKRYDRLYFSYWTSKERMDEKIFREDPMKPAIDRVLEQAGEHIVYRVRRIDLSNLLSQRGIEDEYELNDQGKLILVD